jgi:hypothetical protein
MPLVGVVLPGSDIRPLADKLYFALEADCRAGGQEPAIIAVVLPRARDVRDRVPAAGPLERPLRVTLPQHFGRQPGRVGAGAGVHGVAGAVGGRGGVWSGWHRACPWGCSRQTPLYFIVFHLHRTRALARLAAPRAAARPTSSQSDRPSLPSILRSKNCQVSIWPGDWSVSR